MSTREIVVAASDPEFYTRVAFLALRVAQKKLADGSDDNSRMYAFRVLTGDENVLMMTMHVAASSKAISEQLEKGTGDTVTDARLEKAIEDIWDIRATAFEPPPSPPPPNMIDPPPNLAKPSPHLIPEPEDPSKPPDIPHLYPPQDDEKPPFVDHDHGPKGHTHE